MINPVGVSLIEAQNIASIFSKSLKVKIREGDGWYYDSSKQIIFFAEGDLSSLTYEEVVGNLLHEAGHAHYSTFFNELNWRAIPIPHRQRLFTELLNMIEDFRVEDKVRATYPYAIDFLPLYSFKTNFFIQRKMQGFEDEGIDVPPYLYYVWELYGRMSEMPISFHIKDKDIKEEVERIVDETFDYAILARGKESTQELLDVVLDKIYPLIKHWLDFPEFMCEPLRVSFTFSREKAPFYENSLKNLQGVAKLLEEKMKRLLSDNLFSHYAGAYLTGKKVNEKRLYRFGTGNFKLFERKIVAKKNNYVFALLVDESGSMTRNYGGNGENIKKAVDTAIVFSLVLEKLGIDYELWGFNTGVRQYKKAGGRLDTKIFERMFLSAWAGDSPDPENDASYNCDGFAIKTVFESLMRSPKEKVLFVISDGCPAPPFNHGERLEFELAKAEKKIKVVGFGIGNGTFSVPSFYRHNVVCDNVKELPTLLVKQIGKYLK